MSTYAHDMRQLNPPWRRGRDLSLTELPLVPFGNRRLMEARMPALTLRGATLATGCQQDPAEAFETNLPRPPGP
jgi:hypothetical protein